MNFKNFLYRLIVKLFAPRTKSQGFSSFLLVSTTGLGDTLWGTPAIRALREAYPLAHITMLTSPVGAEALQNNPHLTEIFSIINIWSLLALFSKLRKKKFGAIAIFHTSQRCILPFCALLGASKIIATETLSKGLDDLLTDKIPSSHIHEIERRLQIVAALGARGKDKKMEIFPTLDDQTKAHQILFSSHFLIGLHPGSKDQFKQWPPDNFIHLGQKLKEKYNPQIVVTGTASEKNLVEKIAAEIPGAIPLDHHLSVLTFAALIRRFSLFITNDTGPLHIACALTTPTVVFFSPTNPELCGPYFAPHVHVIQKPPTCWPCLRKRCAEPFCLLQITPQEVLKLANEILK